MSKESKEFINWYLSTLTPEQIAANGGRKGCIKKMKMQDRKNSGRVLIGNIKWLFERLWFLIKGFIIALTALYFINAIFFL